VICEETLARFCLDMGVDVEGPTPLLVAWKLKASNFGEYRRAEFVSGFTALGALTEAKIKSTIHDLEKSLHDEETFPDFYKWLFSYCVGNKEKKALDIEFAMDVWSVVLTPHFPRLKEYLDFVHKANPALKVCTKDFMGSNTRICSRHSTRSQ